MKPMHSASDQAFASGLQLHEEVGRGSVGSVWRATRDGEEYAVKIYDAARDHQDTLRAFRREAAVHMGVRHPAIPRIFEVGVVDGRPYMVSEYVRGQTLASILTRGPLPVRRVFELARDLADALGAVHRKGLVHRDIKPRNILITPGGEVRLIDFGIAMHTQTVHDHEAAGTFLYGAPEQIGVLERVVDGRADLYGLGCVLYECVAGRVPFVSRNLSDLLHAHAALIPARLDTVVSDCGTDMADIVERLLQKDPDERFTDADALRDELERRAPWLGHPRSVESVESERCVGRHHVAARVLEALRSVERGTGHIVLIEGSSGSGKSHLAEHVLQHVTRDGTLVLRARCSAANPIPFSPLRDAVRSISARATSSGVGEHLQRRAREAAGASSGVLRWLAPSVERQPEVALAQTVARDERDVFVNTLRGFFTRLADLEGAAVLWIDDVQWIDDASREVLVALAHSLSSHRLSVMLTGRDEANCADAMARLKAALQPEGLMVVALPPLDETSVRHLVELELGDGVPEWFLQQVAVRSHGNPMAVRQFILTMKEAGALVPSWGRWSIDRGAVASLPVPGTLLELMTGRINMLPTTVREVLAVATLLGARFAPDRLIACCREQPPRAVRDAVGIAMQAQLIEREGEAIRFVHDRIRETLARELPDDVTVYHRRAADHIEASRERQEEDVHQLAEHLLRANPDAEPQRTFHACLQAAEHSVRNHAPARAWELLHAAEPLMPHDLDEAARLRFHRAAGNACFQTERVGEAVRHFRAALTLTTSPIERAATRAHIARAWVFDFATREGTREIAEAFQELNLQLPTAESSDPSALLARLNQMLLDAVSSVDAGLEPATGDELAALKATIALGELGFLSGYYDRNLPFAMQCGILALVPACRAGESVEACQGLSTFAWMVSLLGRRDLVERFCRMAMALARRTGNRQCIAATMSTCAIAWHIGGNVEEAFSLQRDVFEFHSDWLGPLAFQNCCVDLACQYLMRGYATEERRVSLAALRRLEGREGSFLGGYSCRAAASMMSAEATLGLMQEAAEHYNLVESYKGTVPETRAVPWISVEGFRLNWHHHQDEYGVAFSEVVRRHRAWGIPPARGALHGQHFYVVHAWARLAIRLHAAEADRDAALDAVRDAARDLSAAASIPTFKAHALLIRANITLLEGDARAAWATLDEARATTLELDAPWLLLEDARCRARVYRRLGNLFAAQQEALRARSVASRLGWRGCARHIDAEFELQAGSEGSYDSTPTNATARPVTPEAGRLQRRLDALIALSRASASVVDLDELARIALDEVARILGAERAMLFLASEDRIPTFFHGRTASRKDMDTPTGYSSTTVADAFSRRHAVLASTRGDANTLASESVIAYDLRSVIAAPLLAGERVLGVMYLDNRLARGIFNQEHVELLTAMGHLLATAIETARAARLDARLQAETERRKLAETLRELNAQLTSTLNLGESLTLLLAAITREVPHDSSIVLLREGATFEVAATNRADGRRASSPPLPPGLHAHLLTLRDAAVLPGEELNPDRRGESLLVLPIQTGDTLSGALILSRAAGADFTQNEIALARTVTSQAGIAIENARLFQRVKQLAEHDGLTGIFNRREFFRRAADATERCATEGVPLAAVMLDVDHFKRFNDRYGHAIGDEVLRLVARVASGVLGDRAVFGRYGGEEFAALLPDVTPETAAHVADGLRHAIALNRMSSPTYGELQVTVSVGVSTLRAGDDVSALLNRADRALLLSKNNGRNRTTSC